LSSLLLIVIYLLSTVFIPQKSFSDANSKDECLSTIMIYLDAQISPFTRLTQVPEVARAAEETGFDAIWMAETQHNPFLPCALVAEHTKRLRFGTAIAVSFARSPAVMAHTAWDLAEASEGRFILGLGTQVKAHIERRFGMKWPDSVVGKLREQIEAMRVFWQSWQSGERLKFRGEYYNITLSSPFFTPPAIKHHEIPIYIAGVNTGLARLAGETADGFHAHPFHTPKYLEDVILPAMDEGADKAGRTRQDISMVTHAFIVTNSQEREFVRQQISFYASTPSYRRVMEHHGWGEIRKKLSALASKQQWGEMPGLIDDTIVEHFATVAEPDDLADALFERYQGIANRITVYVPFAPGERDKFWRQLCKGFPKA
jgi:probable F420-dependent oxidoreductase